MLSLNQLPQAVHLQGSAANSPTRLSLLYSLQFSHAALGVNMAVQQHFGPVYSQPIEKKKYCQVIVQVIKQIEDKFCKESYLILYLNDTTLFGLEVIEPAKVVLAS